MDGARSVGWKRLLRLAGALALPPMALLGFGTATVHADGPPRCGGAPGHVANVGCGDRAHGCRRGGDCDRDHDDRSTPAPTPPPTPVARPAAGATLPHAPGGPRVAVTVAVGTAASAAGSSSSAPSPAVAQPVALVPARPPAVLVDLPLVRLLVIAVVVAVAAAVLPRAVRWPR